MTQLHISLPDDISAFIAAQMVQDGYTNADLYVSDLLREAQKRRARQQLDQQLLEGINGPFIPMTDDRWKELRDQAEARIAHRDIRS